MFIIMVIRQKSAWSRRPLITQQRASHYGVICCLRKYGTRPDMILPGRRLTSTWWTTWGLLCCSTCPEILFYLAHLFDAAFPAELDAMLFRPMKHTADELAQCKSGVVRKLIWHPVLCVCHLIVKKKTLLGNRKETRKKRRRGSKESCNSISTSSPGEATCYFFLALEKEEGYFDVHSKTREWIDNSEKTSTNETCPFQLELWSRSVTF